MEEGDSLIKALDSRSEPSSLDVGLNPCFNLTEKDGPLDGRKINGNNKNSQMDKVT